MKKIIKDFNEEIYKCDVNDKKNVIKIFMNLCKIVEEKKYNIEINNINNHIKKILSLINKKYCNIYDNCSNCLLIEDNLAFINFIEYKNKLLIKEITNLDTYNELIKNILNNYKNKYNKITNDINVKNAINKLLLEKKNDFNGNWDIIICGSNGFPKKIELIDPIKINKIYEYINNN